MKSTKIKKILVANRGAIAERIFATCREMDIATCAIAHEKDQHLHYVKCADDWRLLSGETLTDTYLNMDQVIGAALSMQADAIHPGYGFLSENSKFAQKVMESGLIFIGPSPSVMDQLGNKVNAKRVAEKLGVPTLPGYHGDDQSLDILLTHAKRIGFPLLIKAAAGGGGKGMRVVEDLKEFEEKLTQAKSEAIRSFGDDKVLLEKYLVGPKHIEVQMLCDQHGNYLHLFERDCSVQRRHQKIVEEAPAPSLTPKEREAVCGAAVKLCAGIQYQNAGTVEFIYEKGNFYFLEVNARLQVEHGVSELVTGVDIVREQIRIAEGNPISFQQKDLVLNGSAVQVRIYAEDPTNQFFPATGNILFSQGSEQKNVRFDTTYRTGDELTTLFDPMMAKLMSHAKTRDQAIKKLQVALSDVCYLGIKNNIQYLYAIIDHPNFRSGLFTTGMISTYGQEIIDQMKHEFDKTIPQDVLSYIVQELSEMGGVRISDRSNSLNSAWKGLGNLRITL
jgi:3-methylcrotonyl-CoA carboxylase alpha subunit